MADAKNHDTKPTAESDKAGADTGTPPAETGTPPAETGAPPAETGTPTAVSGKLKAESSTLKAEAGAPEAEAGAPEAEAGAPEAGADALKAEASAPPAESGAQTAEGGRQAADSAQHAADAGPPTASDEWPVQPWGAPLARLDRKWTQLEARLAWWVLGLEIATLCFAVFMNGMSTGSDGAAKSGLVLRVVLTAGALGMAAHLGAKKHKHHDAIVTAAVVAGAVLGPLWANLGVDYFGNARNWIQNASVVSLVGGISNLAKRLTIWLALLGASVATAQGKHINVDVAMRFLKPRQRVPVAVVGWLASAIVCFAAVWGFIDQIAIENFKIEDVVNCPDDPKKACPIPVGKRLGEMAHHVRRDLFLAGRQISLDLKSIPKVASGAKYDQYLTPAEWNAWVRGEPDWTHHFPEADVKNMYVAEEASALPRSPIIVVPGAAENTQELLIRELNLIFPFGLFIIAVRFLLRCVLAISGQVKVDPDLAHADDEEDEKALDHSHEALPPTPPDEPPGAAPAKGGAA